MHLSTELQSLAERMGLLGQFGESAFNAVLHTRWGTAECCWMLISSFLVGGAASSGASL